MFASKRKYGSTALPIDSSSCCRLNPLPVGSCPPSCSGSGSENQAAATSRTRAISGFSDVSTLPPPPLPPLSLAAGAGAPWPARRRTARRRSLRRSSGCAGGAGAGGLRVVPAAQAQAIGVGVGVGAGADPAAPAPTRHARSKDRPRSRANMSTNEAPDTPRSLPPRGEGRHGCDGASHRDRSPRTDLAVRLLHPEAPRARSIPSGSDQRRRRGLGASR